MDKIKEVLSEYKKALSHLDRPPTLIQQTHIHNLLNQREMEY